MKTKLLIILFLGLTVTGFGQIVNDSMIKFHHGPTAKLYIDNTGFDPNVVPDTYIALNILHLWDHYKTDCYNDSTANYSQFYTNSPDSIYCGSCDSIKKQIGSVRDSTSAWGTYVSGGWYAIENGYAYRDLLKHEFRGYTHKEISFNGFMEWIEKKYKLKN